MWRTKCAYPVALTIIATLVLFVVVQRGRSQDRQTSYARWQYHVVQFGPTACSGDELPGALNAAGDQGWELVSFTPLEKGPSEIVLQTASLGYGREVVPNLTDSWQGVITPVEAQGCQVILKRPVY